MLRVPQQPEAVARRTSVPTARADPALRERFEQLLGAGRNASRPDRNAASTTRGTDRGKTDEAAKEGEGKGGGEGAGPVPTGAQAFRELLAADAGGDTPFVLAGAGGAIHMAAANAAEAAAAPAPRGADPAMLQLAERIASLHLPPSGSYRIELPGIDRVAARVEHSGQGGFAIALHLPTKATEHRRRLAAELAMHLDARGLTRCIVRLEDEQPEA